MQQAIAMSNPPRHYVAGHDVFVVSTDGGKTWAPQPNNLPSLDLHFFAASPADPKRLYALPAGLGLWTSHDGGRTWTEATMPLGVETQSVTLAVAPTNPDKLFLTRTGQVAISTDRGMTWQTRPGSSGIITAISVASDGAETVYVGTNQGVLRQGAEGSWKSLPISVDGAVFALAVIPGQPQRIAVVDNNGNFYRSDDAGRTWASN